MSMAARLAEARAKASGEAAAAAAIAIESSVESSSESSSESTDSCDDDDDDDDDAVALAAKQQLEQISRRLACVGQQKREHERAVAADFEGMKSSLATAAAAAAGAGAVVEVAAVVAPTRAGATAAAAASSPSSVPGSPARPASPSASPAWGHLLSPVLPSSSAPAPAAAAMGAQQAGGDAPPSALPAPQLLSAMQSSFLEMKSQLGQLAAQQSQLVQRLQYPHHLSLSALSPAPGGGAGGVGSGGGLADSAGFAPPVPSPGDVAAASPSHSSPSSAYSTGEHELRRVEQELLEQKQKNAALESEMRAERQSVAAAHLVTKKLIQTENKLAQLRQEKMSSFLSALGAEAEPDLAASAKHIASFAPILACGANSVVATLRSVFRRYFVAETDAELGVVDVERLASFAAAFNLIDSRLDAATFEAVMVAGEAGLAMSFPAFLTRLIRLADRKFPGLGQQERVQRVYDIVGVGTLRSALPAAPTAQVRLQHTPPPPAVAPEHVASLADGAPVDLNAATAGLPDGTPNGDQAIESAWARTHSQSSSDLALELSRRGGAHGEHDEWLLDLIEQETAHVGGLILATGELSASDTPDATRQGGATAEEGESVRASPVLHMTLASALDDMPCIELFSMLAGRGLRALFDYYAKHERSSKPAVGSGKKLPNGNQARGYSKLDTPGDARVLDIDAFIRLLGAMRLCPQVVPASGAAKVFSASVPTNRRTQRFGAFCEALARLSVLVVASRSQQTWTVREMCVTMFFDLDRARTAEGRSILFYTPVPLLFGAEIEALLFNLFAYYSPTNMQDFPDGGWGMSSSQLMKFSRDFGLVGEAITPPHVDLISQKCLHLAPLPGSTRMRRARFHTFATFCLTILKLVEARWPAEQERSPSDSINKLFARRIPGYE
jgi:hypothetical protein